MSTEFTGPRIDPDTHEITSRLEAHSRNALAALRCKAQATPGKANWRQPRFRRRGTA